MTRNRQAFLVVAVQQGHRVSLRYRKAAGVRAHPRPPAGTLNFLTFACIFTEHFSFSILLETKPEGNRFPRLTVWMCLRARREANPLWNLSHETPRWDSWIWDPQRLSPESESLGSWDLYFWVFRQNLETQGPRATLIQGLSPNPNLETEKSINKCDLQCLQRN